MQRLEAEEIANVVAVIEQDPSKQSLLKAGEIVLLQNSAFFQGFFCFPTPASNELQNAEYQCEKLAPICA